MGDMMIPPVEVRKEGMDPMDRWLFKMVIWFWILLGVVMGALYCMLKAVS